MKLNSYKKNKKKWNKNNNLCNFHEKQSQMFRII